MEIKCTNCNHTEKTDKDFFVKLIGGAMPVGGFWAWTTYLFAGTGFAMVIVVAIIGGGVAMLMFKDEIVEWIISQDYECKECGGIEWESLDETQNECEDIICPYCEKNDKNIFLKKKREWLCLNCRRRFTYAFTYGHANKNESEFDIYECYKILDCTESDTDEIIKKKYRKAVSEYHPDKIQSKDLPKGFHDFANQQMHKINNA